VVPKLVLGSTRRLFALSLVVTLLGGCPYAASTADVLLHDASRNLDISAKVNYPTGDATVFGTCGRRSRSESFLTRLAIESVVVVERENLPSGRKIQLPARGDILLFASRLRQWLLGSTLGEWILTMVAFVFFVYMVTVGGTPKGWNKLDNSSKKK
jgi:hypothetical protein